MKTKVFDCVRMKDEIQEEIYKTIKDLAPEKQVAYYQKKVSEDRQLSDKFSRMPVSRFPIDRRPADGPSRPPRPPQASGSGS
jgi:hypothetical protein